MLHTGSRGEVLVGEAWEEGGERRRRDVLRRRRRRS